ncbi:MAG TPA: efflux RND transporter periplasmic adaptor subunit, partial [Polyangiaceae bacterium LLY-WYZ-15_(1-7)]|nr:efflux RND transporter periplasmic adaptor subunit [Polyangiaceae bacterium LLY-WYZ-15_(1-7)]
MSRGKIVGIGVVLVALGFGIGVWVGGGADEGHGSGEDGQGHGHGHGQGSEQGQGSGGAESVWTCSMHPQIRSNSPGDCPICGMDLVPASSVEEESSPARIALSERARTLARVRTARVGEGAPTANGPTRRFVGRVAVDETRVRVVTSWIGGRIDRLHVRATGERVRRGQTVATLYSPEVYAAHQELLAAKRQVARLGEGESTAATLARRSAEAALEAARERLRLLGLDGATLTRLEEAERPTRAVPVRSPFGGTVLERVATQGAYVQTGAPLYRLADLGRVWVQLEAYERDLPLLAVGRPVRLRFEALGDVSVEGEVAFVDPVVDPERRVAQVRVAVPNPDGTLRPGMVGEALVEGVDAASGALSIPASAPLFTGQRSVVYVAVPNAERPTYEARTVVLGPRRGGPEGGSYPVLSGLEAGDEVVVHGAFALDAELQIQGGASMMTRPGDDARLAPSDALKRQLAPVVRAYLDLAEALAADDDAAAARAAGALHEAIGAVRVPAAEEDAARRRWDRLADR